MNLKKLSYILSMISTVAVLGGCTMKNNKLTPLQHEVTQNCGTEPPFKNEYWENHEPGIYVEVVSGEPLFSSLDKFDSGTGWPSFTKPINKNNIAEKQDNLLSTARTEVRSKKANSHLGHVFLDGPAPTGARYCINSASLKFIPAKKLKEQGYIEYEALFGFATLAGGCFWGMEDIIRKIPGVLKTSVGYTGGTLKDPTYEMVKKGDSNHAEAIDIIFDPNKISYQELLNYFFRMHDPTTLNQQGGDVGSQYRSAIFYNNDEQKIIAEKVIQKVDASGKWKQKIITQVVPAGKFYDAEEYHQDYLKKHPGGYTCHYLRN